MIVRMSDLPSAQQVETSLHASRNLDEIVFNLNNISRRTRCIWTEPPIPEDV